MKHDILIGQVDYSVLVFIPDSASTDGSGKTGLVAANLTAGYTRVETDNDVVHTDGTSSLNDLAALTTAHTDWGLKEVSSSLAPGLYRLDLPDGAFASGAWSAVVYVMVTTSAAAASPMEFTLIGIDKQAAAWPANVTQFGGSAGTFAAGIPETKVASIAANAITATAINADAITDAKVASDVTIASVTGAVGSVTGAVGSVTGNVGGNVVGSVASVTAGVTVTTNNDKTGYGLSAAAVQAVWDALTSALTTVGSIGKLLADNVNATISSRSSHSAADVWAAGTRTLTAFDASFKTGYALSAAGVQAVWDALTSALTTVGSIGKLLVDNIDAAISTRLATAGYTAPPTVGAIADQVWDEAIAGHAGAGSTGATLSAASAPSAAAVADAVWDEAMADHLTGGSTGASLNGAGSAGDPWTTALPGAYGAGTAGKIVGDNLPAILLDTAEIGTAGAGLTNIDLPNQTMNITGNITGNLSGSVGSVTGAVGSVTAGVTLAASAVQAIWDALTSALTTVGSIGKLLVDNVNAAINSRSSHSAADVWASVTRTLTAATNITSTGGTTVPQTGDSFARLGAPAGASVSVDIAAIEAQTDDIGAAGAGLTALATAANLTTVDTVVDSILALLVDARVEPGQGAPAATEDPLTKLDFLYKLARNRITQTATELKVYADNATTVDHKATVSDDGTTYDRGEIATGP